MYLGNSSSSSATLSAPAAAPPAADPHLARELHDQVAQPLVELVLRLHEIQDRSRLEGTLRDELAEIEDSARRILKHSREMLIDLRGQGQIRLHFVEALRSEMASSRPGFGRVMPSVHASTHWPRFLNAWAAFNLLRIVKEAVANAVVHGKAQQIDVFLDASAEGDAVVEIVDDGVGIKETASGFGMLGMAERAVILGGTFRAGDSDTRGTRVEVRVPKHRIE